MNPNIQENLSILNQLEWNLFSKLGQDHALFKETVDKIFSRVVPRTDLEGVFNLTEHYLLPEHYDEILEIRGKLSSIEPEIFPQPLGSKLKKGAVLTLEELAGFARLIEIVFENFSFFKESDPRLDTARTSEFKQFFKRGIIKEFRSFVSAEGEVDFFKHPKLKALFAEQVEIETTIRSLLSQTRQAEAFQKALQFDSHDVINDKYVLPVKSDAFSSALGSIVARSESGRTLFIEPTKVKELNRKRFEIILKIDQIIHDIAKDFCLRFAPWSALIDNFIESAKIFDEFYTRSRLALELQLSRPHLLDNPDLRLTGFFHPLIKNPVTNNLYLSSDSKGLVISGPNTGGKTASIKAVALCVIFVKHGLFAPARRAEIHLFENIFYFGNDQQSLPEGLSSFSAEVKNYSELLGNLGSSNLVVIDEIFNSTSSEEASALALSLFNELAKDNFTKIIVSTHHQTLKTMAHAQEDFLSCHVGFDPSKNEPTYKLIYGMPGSSQALEIFRKLSQSNALSERIYTKAVQKLDNKMINYEKLLQELSLKEAKLNNLLRQNESLQKDLANQKESAKGIIKLKVEEEVHRAKKELDKLLGQARSFLEEMKAGEVPTKKKLSKKFGNIEAQMGAFSPPKSQAPGMARNEKYSNLPIPKELKVGEKYFCGFVNQIVTLQEVKNKSEVVVARGALKITCPINTLRIPNKNEIKDKVVVTTTRSNEVKLEYDCRGMRLSEMQNLVENTTPELLAGNVPFINFIHGHGDGVLKKWLRNFVKSNKSLEWDKTESGNDGETRVIAS